MKYLNKLNIPEIIKIPILEGSNNAIYGKFEGFALNSALFG